MGTPTVIDTNGRLYKLSIDNDQDPSNSCHTCAFINNNDACDTYNELCVYGDQGNFRLDVTRLALSIDYRKYPKLF